MHQYETQLADMSTVSVYPVLDAKQLFKVQDHMVETVPFGPQRSGGHRLRPRVDVWRFAQ